MPLSMCRLRIGVTLNNVSVSRARTPQLRKYLPPCCCVCVPPSVHARVTETTSRLLYCITTSRDHREPRYGSRGGGRGGGFRRGGFRGGFDSYRGGFRDDRFGGRGGGRPPIIRSKYRVIVENLSSRVSWQDLKVS